MDSAVSVNTQFHQSEDLSAALEQFWLCQHKYSNDGPPLLCGPEKRQQTELESMACELQGGAVGFGNPELNERPHTKYRWRKS